MKTLHTDKRRLFNRWFIRRASNYVVTCLFLAVLNYQTSPHTWWVGWVAAGWGMQLLLSLIWRLTDCDQEEDYRRY